MQLRCCPTGLAKRPTKVPTAPAAAEPFRCGAAANACRCTFAEPRCLRRPSRAVIAMPFQCQIGLQRLQGLRQQLSKKEQFAVLEWCRTAVSRQGGRATAAATAPWRRTRRAHGRARQPKAGHTPRTTPQKIPGLQVRASRCSGRSRVSVPPTHLAPAITAVLSGGA